MTRPTPAPQRGGRRRQERVSRLSEPLLVAVVGVTVIALCVVAAVMNDRSDSADPSAAIQRASDPSVSTSIAPQPVLPAAEVKLAEKPRATEAREKVRKLRDSAERAGREVSQAPTVVRVGSFNILGTQHTAPGGTKGGRWPSAAARLPGTIERITAHQVSVVGLQEAQPDQLAGLVNGTGFTVYPSADTNPLDRVNSILYDPQVFEYVSGSSFQLSNGKGFRPQPVLLLRHIATGREVYFVNAHPPAGNDRATVAKRIASMQRIVSVVNGLKATGVPVILTGDMNDREAFLQRVVAPAGLVASVVRPGPISVDWVVGTPDVAFSSYVRDTSTASRRISDHFFISATATIGAAG